jgi:hypothetical protein
VEVNVLGLRIGHGTIIALDVPSSGARTFVISSGGVFGFAWRGKLADALESAGQFPTPLTEKRMYGCRCRHAEPASAVPARAGARSLSETALEQSHGGVAQRADPSGVDE